MSSIYEYVTNILEFLFNGLKIVFIMLLVLGFLTAVGYAGYYGGQRELREEAIKAGAAEYRVDQKGLVTFHWIDKR